MENNKNTVDSILPGDIFYDVNFSQINKYKYLCVHPNNPRRHILIDKNEDSIRIFEDRLNMILSKGLNTYYLAQSKLIELLEERIKNVKKDFYDTRNYK